MQHFDRFVAATEFRESYKNTSKNLVYEVENNIPRSGAERLIVKKGFFFLLGKEGKVEGMRGATEKLDQLAFSRFVSGKFVLWLDLPGT